jgi:hypothetical protein
MDLTEIDDLLFTQGSGLHMPHKRCKLIKTKEVVFHSIHTIINYVI